MTTRKSPTDQRDELLAKMRSIISGAKGRVVYYREEDALKALTAQIRTLDKKIGGGASVLPRWSGVHARSVTSNAGRRPTNLYAARAYAARLRGRRP